MAGRLKIPIRASRRKKIARLSPTMGSFRRPSGRHFISARQTSNGDASKFEAKFATDVALCKSRHHLISTNFEKKKNSDSSGVAIVGGRHEYDTGHLLICIPLRRSNKLGTRSSQGEHDVNSVPGEWAECPVYPSTRPAMIAYFGTSIQILEMSIKFFTLSRIRLPCCRGLIDG